MADPVYPPFPATQNTRSHYPSVETNILSPTQGYGSPGYPPSTDIYMAAYPPVTGEPPLTEEWNPMLISGDDEVVKTLRVKYEQSIMQQRNMIGIAVILGVVDDHLGPNCTDNDIDNIKATFENLKFGVWMIKNPTAKEIAAVVHIATTHSYMYEKRCECIVFYFVGHGGSFNGKSYVVPVQGGSADPDPKYYIDEGIIIPFQSNQPGKMFSLFFFDCCPKQSNLQPFSSGPFNSPSFLLPNGQCLVAYATSLHYPSNYSEGGIWTKHLCANINKYDLPLSTVLDITYDDIFKETTSSTSDVQGSLYNSSVGLFYLRTPFKRSKTQLQKAVVETVSSAESKNICSFEPVESPQTTTTTIKSSSSNKTSAVKSTSTKSVPTISLKAKERQGLLVEPSVAAKEINKIAGNWKKLGENLSLKQSELSVVKAESQNNQEALLKLLKKAKKKNPKFNYSDLMAATFNTDEKLYNELMK